MDHEQAIENLAVERYLLSEMTPAEREAFEAHYFICVACAADLKAAEEFLGHARELWAAEPPPAFDAAPPPKSSIWNSFAWLQPRIAAPAMAALLIAAFAGAIASLRLQTQLTDAVAPMVVAATVLRQETRGTAPVITAVRGQPVLIAFDLPETPNVALQFLVRSSDGTVALSLAGGTHELGERVTLLIPKIELSPGRYNLSVEASATFAGDRSVFATYPMEVKYPSGDK